ncbi:ankyrin repeat domain-containing protein [Malaciobacter mytili]|uniref:Ankyrin domain-containing protein n=1 Tax=Malaciobacter mytili LMG 24559 TaxID=1032238 RepID=A0AAX2AHU3_9BACT|nr:ankyrin repeat domain-containing protein [Malaciobacter mytili]AXH15323.1 ankyrin domain-containing protein [Malaciobacter mytili LMG 24559]RXI38193.1 hypothetical protein CRU99_11445 [Malaciobacter mytili]RXK15720.1 hypothetical protein CP985_07365 [Malaciobacter mytili LMG 24559]
MSTNFFIENKSLNKSFSLKKLLFSGLDINYQDKDGWCVLFESIAYNENINSLISLGVNINIRDKKGRNALYWAIKFKNHEAVRLLIKNYINTYVTPTLSAVHFAIYNDDVKMLKTLKNCGLDLNFLDEINATGLIYAVLYNKLHCIDYLLKNGANIYENDTLGNSAYSLANELQIKSVITKFNKRN